MSPDLESELWIWRPILAGKVSLSEVKEGVATVEDINKLNALLDMQDDIQAQQSEAVKK